MAEEKNDPENVNISCTLPKDLHDKVRASAEEGDRTISQQIKRIVRMYYQYEGPEKEQEK